MNINMLFACVALGLTAQAGGPATDSGLKWIDGHEMNLSDHLIVGCTLRLKPAGP